MDRTQYDALLDAKELDILKEFESSNSLLDHT